jgi:signal transduction histidine kinase
LLRLRTDNGETYQECRLPAGRAEVRQSQRRLQELPTGREETHYKQPKGNAMNRPIALGLAALALLWSAGLAAAQQSGTAAEAKAMLERSVAALKANKATALSEFNDKNNKQFHDRDLYVFCYNTSDGKFTAHPNPAMMGTDARTLKLKDDSFGQRVYDAIKGSSEGSVVTVDYMFPKPGTSEPVSKESFVTRVGDQGCGVGYYK